MGGDGGGFYTKDDYRRIVEYAAERFVTIVPEIDLPGHTNAALSAYPELNCDGVAPAPYEGTEVGFSSLCASPERADGRPTGSSPTSPARSPSSRPGRGCTSAATSRSPRAEADYLDLVRRMTQAGAATGKTIIGWHEMGASRELPAGTIGQYWSFVEPEDDAAELTRSFVEQGGSVILSPADVAYLDMKYVDDPQNALGHTLGLDWAKGPTTIDEAYLWEPSAIVPGVDERDILGVEAPIWTETLASISDVEFMAFPRILGDRGDRVVAGAGGGRRARHGGVLRPRRHARRALDAAGRHVLPGARRALGRLAPGALPPHHAPCAPRPPARPAPHRPPHPTTRRPRVRARRSRVRLAPQDAIAPDRLSPAGDRLLTDVDAADMPPVHILRTRSPHVGRSRGATSIRTPITSATRSWTRDSGPRRSGMVRQQDALRAGSPGTRSGGTSMQGGLRRIRVAWLATQAAPDPLGRAAASADGSAA